MRGIAKICRILVGNAFSVREKLHLFKKNMELIKWNRRRVFYLVLFFCNSDSGR